MDQYTFVLHVIHFQLSMVKMKNLQSKIKVDKNGKRLVRKIGILDKFIESAPYKKLLELNRNTIEKIIKTAKEIL